MALLKHLEEAAERLKRASARMNAARTKSPSPENLHDWLDALTEYTVALSDLHDLNMEAIQERLDKLEARQRQIGPPTGP